MKQYLDLCNRVLNDGVMVHNERTGKNVLTLINADLEYDVGAQQFPMITTRKTYWKAAIAELLGYIRGYDNAEDFRNLGTKTWDMNANENKAWLTNPYRKGTDDMGNVYGVIGRRMRATEFDYSDRVDESIHLTNNGYTMDGFGVNYNNQSSTSDGSGEYELWVKHIDQFKKVYDNLRNGIDDRGEIITFWDPTEFHRGCLRPCMHTHTFSLVGDTLHLTSYQRSCDVPLGLTFNQIQVYTLLALMAQITGHKPGKAYHKIVNAHIYEDQIDLMKEQVTREPFESPKLIINPNIKTLEDLETWVTLDDFNVEGYKHHDPIAYPFSV